MCSYNDGNVKLVITHLQLLLVSSNLNIRYYNIQVVFHHHLLNYCSYSFQATSFHISILIDIILIFMLSSIFIYKITVFTFFKLPPFICLYNDLTCITHLSLLLFSSNLYRQYYNIYAVFQYHLQIYRSYLYIKVLMLSSGVNYKITIITFFKLPLFICSYNDLTCITHLSLLLFSSNLYRQYYNISTVFQYHLQTYRSYLFEATSFHMFICSYNDLTCITHLPLSLFSINLKRHYNNLY